jgi:Domain of unknown function (DUF6089)
MLSPIGIIAQSTEIGFGVGGMNYKGDVSNYFDFLNFRPGGEVFVKRNFSPVVALRGAFLAGKIAGNQERYNEAIAKFNELVFSTWIFEGSLTAEINYFNFRDKYNRPKVTLYLFAGLAGFYNIPVPSPEPQKGSLIKPAIPFGLGVKAMVGKRTNLGWEFGARKTFNDMIDGASDIDPATGIQRGYRYDKDWYYFTGFTISYIITKIPCPYTYEGI